VKNLLYRRTDDIFSFIFRQIIGASGR
jgi:hypothetical protein